MQGFEKAPERMTLEEARAAYGELVRNMGWDDIHALENDPLPRSGDSEFILIRKRVYRRIADLERRKSNACC